MTHRFGLDLGGTKIEAKVFDADWREVRARRVDTPHHNYDHLIEALTGQIDWLRGSETGPIRIGIGLPGYIDRATGESFTTNIDAKGRGLRKDLRAIAGIEPVFENDCNCFTVSEAVLGAGKPYRVVIGLILGTGVGGGICIDGQLRHGSNGAAGEFGHLGIPASVMRAHALPLLRCGCGRLGCYETLASGPGLVRLCQTVSGEQHDTRTIAALAAEGDETMRRVMAIWSTLVAELISAMQCVADPDCIVLGGGLSNIPGVETMLQQAVAPILLPATRMPAILRPAGGDSSGTRGAALLTMPRTKEDLA